MHELTIMEFPNGEEKGTVLFKGNVFDDGAGKKLKKLYKQGYELERNEDGMAVMLFPYKNKYDANLCKVQINVKKGSQDR